MNTFYQDIFQQPQTLQSLLDYYRQGEGATRLAATPTKGPPLFTGMGASFHGGLGDGFIYAQSGSRRATS